MEIFDESLERPYRKELDEQYARTLGHLGLVDATLYSHSTPERVEERWAVELDSNPNILKSTD